MYGDLVRICPSGSKTSKKPPCPCTVRFLKIVASFIINTSISSLRLGGLYNLLNAKFIFSNKFSTTKSVPTSAVPYLKSGAT